MYLHAPSQPLFAFPLLFAAPAAALEIKLCSMMAEARARTEILTGDDGYSKLKESLEWILSRLRPQLAE